MPSGNCYISTHEPHGSRIAFLNWVLTMPAHYALKLEVVAASLLSGQLRSERCIIDLSQQMGRFCLVSQPTSQRDGKPVSIETYT